MHYSLLVLLVPCAFGYVFDCLDNCECDTDDEVVHCHNGERTQLTLPTGQRLRGFPVIGMTYNNLVNLPDEKTLLSKFPDLKVIDVERNPNFNCSTLYHYDKVKIVSDCHKNISEISRVPRIFRPSLDCDLACQADRHYKALHKYVLQLWSVIKQKYEDFNLDDTLRQLQEFFLMVASRVNQIGTNIQVTLRKQLDNEDESSPIKDLPEAQVTSVPEPREPQITPMAELRDVEIK